MLAPSDSSVFLRSLFFVVVVVAAVVVAVVVLSYGIVLSFYEPWLVGVSSVRETSSIL